MTKRDTLKEAAEMLTAIAAQLHKLADLVTKEMKTLDDETPTE